jgi:hypothetical protein
MGLSFFNLFSEDEKPMIFKKHFAATLMIVLLVFPMTTVHAHAALPPLMQHQTAQKAQVGLALAGMYNRAGFDDKTNWENMICSGMTPGGCDYFKSNNADALWSNNADVALSVVTFEEQSTLADGSQVWKMKIVTYQPGAQDGEVQHAYVHVVPDSSKGWLLNRVLIAPYIAFN